MSLVLINRNYEEILFSLMKSNSNLRRHMWGLKAKLMHNPASFDTVRGSIPVEH